MGLTTDYRRLAASAPKKARHKSFADPTPPRDKALLIEQCAVGKPAHLSQLVPPLGVARYYLRVPASKYQHALKAGCRWDTSIHRLYIDNPNPLSDFAAWKPSLYRPPAAKSAVNGPEAP